MAGPPNESRDNNMLEIVTPAASTLRSSLEISAVGPMSNGPVTISMSQDEYNSRTSRESVLQRLSEALMRHSLAKIDLSQRGLQASDARLVKMALSQNAKLTVLKLGYNNLGDQGVATLAAGIALHRSLVLIDLGFNNFGDNGAKALASGMRQASLTFDGGSLHTLYLAGNLIGEDGAVAMADFIRHGSRLKRLYMTGNRIGSGGVRAITEAIFEDEMGRRGEFRPEDNFTFEINAGDSNLQSENPRTRFEGMQELFLGGTGMNVVGCQAVSRLLERSTSLKVLSLPNCEIGDEEISFLASSFRANKSMLPIESVQLSFNNISHEGLEALVNALWGSTTLKELKLDNNEIGDRGAHQIAAILPALKALETLDVGFNVIKAAGLNILMKAIADTDQIRSLSLSGNAIDVPSAKSVAYALAYNQSLKSIYLVHCSMDHEARRNITAGAVSNAHTALRNITGFDLGRLGFPGALKYWNNEQILNFVHLMYEKHQSENSIADGDELDPLNFLPGSNEKDPIERRPKPLEANIVVEMARRSYHTLVANGVDVFSRRRGQGNDPSFGSPLATDAIVTETVTSSHQLNGAIKELLPSQQARSFVAPPDSTATREKKEIPDPARKQRIVEWLCTNIQHVNELAQLPFSSRELWRLHQHYFTPVVNESGGGVMQGPGGQTTLSFPEYMIGYPGNSNAAGSMESSFEYHPNQVSDPALPGTSPVAPGSLPLLKRKVSYRFLGDAVCQPRSELKAENTFQQASVARLIESGPTGHSLPPKTKRARRNRTRISFVPRIKAKLDSYMDVCHEKALITMRQLYFVEQAILKGHVNPLEPGTQPAMHLSGTLASEAEMIVIDMI